MATLKQAVSNTLDAGITLVGTVSAVANTATDLVSIGSRRVNQWKQEQEFLLDKELIAFKDSSVKNLAKEMAQVTMQANEFRAKSQAHESAYDSAMLQLLAE